MTLTRKDLTDREWELTELAFHEAGHSCAGVLGGAVLRSAVVSGGLRHGDVSGVSSFEATPGFDEPQAAYAGCWAQAAWRHGRHPTLREVHAVLDTTGREDYRVLLDVGGSAAGAGVIPVLARCWPSVAALAAQLWRETIIRHSDVLAALGLTEATAGMGISMIRSGCAPGSFTITRPAA